MIAFCLFAIVLAFTQVNGDGLRQQLRQAMENDYSVYKGYVFSVSSCTYQALTDYSVYTTNYTHIPVYDIYTPAQCYYLCEDNICYSFSPPTSHQSTIYVFYGVKNGCKSIVVSTTNKLPSSPTNCGTSIWAITPDPDTTIPGQSTYGCEVKSSGIAWSFKTGGSSYWNSFHGVVGCTALTPLLS